MKTRIEELNSKINSKQDTISDTGWVDCELEDSVSASSTGYGGAKGIQYRKIGNHMYVRGSVAFTNETWTAAGSPIKLTTLPYAPKYNVYWLNPLTGTRIARIYIHSSGTLNFEWTLNISDASNVLSTALSWIEIEGDFWID